MKPGDLVRTYTPYFYSTVSQVNQHISDSIIQIGTIGLIIKPPDGTWVKLILSDGKIGWMNWNYMEVINEAW